MSDFKINIGLEADGSKLGSQVDKAIKEQQNKKIKIDIDTGKLGTTNNIGKGMQNISTDAKKATRDVQELANRLKNMSLKSSLNSGLKSTKLDTSFMDGMKKQTDSLKRYQLERQNIARQIREMDLGISKLQKNYGSQIDSSSLEKLKQSASDVKKSFSDLNNTDLGQIKANINDVKQTVKELNSEGLFNKRKSNNDAQIDKLRIKLKQLKEDGKITQEQFDRLNKSVNELGKTSGTDKFANGLKGVNRELTKAQNQTKNLKKAFGQNFFSDLYSNLRTFQLGYVIGNTIRGAVNSAKQSIRELDDAMREVRRVADTQYVDSPIKTEAIKQDAMEISKTLGIASSDFIKSLSTTMKLGFSEIGQATEIARQTMMFANVADMSADVASEASATLINAWNLDVVKQYKKEVDGVTKSYTEFGEAIDMVNYIGNTKPIDSAGLMEALKRSSNVANQFGMSMYELSAMITAANSTIQDAEKVGTGMRTLILRMSGADYSDKEEDVAYNKIGKTIKNLAGIDIFEKDGKSLKNMTVVMEELQSKWDTFDDATQKTLAKQIGGVRQSETFLAIMNNYEMYQKTLAELNKGLHLGSAEKENLQFMDSITGKLNNLKTTWEQVITNIFLSESIKGFIDGLTKVLEVVANITSGLRDMNLAFPALLAGFGILNGFLKFLATYGMNLGVGAFANMFSGAGGAVGELANSMGTARKSGIGLITSLNAGFSRLLPIIATAGVVIAASLYKSLKDANGKLIEETELSITKRKETLKGMKQEHSQLEKNIKRYKELTAKKSLSNKEDSERKQILQDLSIIDDNLVNYDLNGNISDINFSGVASLQSELDKKIGLEELKLERDLRLEIKLSRLELGGENNDTGIQWLKNELQDTIQEKLIKSDIKAEARISGLDLNFAEGTIDMGLRALGIDKEISSELSKSLNKALRLVPLWGAGELISNFIGTGKLNPSKSNSIEGKIEKIIKEGINSKRDISELIKQYSKMENELESAYNDYITQSEVFVERTKALQGEFDILSGKDAVFNSLDENTIGKTKQLVGLMDNLGTISVVDTRNIFNSIIDGAKNGTIQLDELIFKIEKARTSYEETGDLDAYRRSLATISETLAKSLNLDLNSAIDKRELTAFLQALDIPEIEIELKTKEKAWQDAIADADGYFRQLLDMADATNGKINDAGLELLVDADGIYGVPEKLKELARAIDEVRKKEGRIELTVDESNSLYTMASRWTNELETVENAINSLDTSKLEVFNSLINDIRFKQLNGKDITKEIQILSDYIGSMTNLNPLEVSQYIDYKLEYRESPSDVMFDFVAQAEKMFKENMKSENDKNIAIPLSFIPKFKEIENNEDISEEFRNIVKKARAGGYLSKEELEIFYKYVPSPEQESLDMLDEDAYKEIQVRIVTEETVNRTIKETKEEISKDNEILQGQFSYRFKDGLNENGAFDASLYKKNLEDYRTFISQKQSEYKKDSELYKAYGEELKKVDEALGSSALQDKLDNDSNKIEELKTKAQETVNAIKEANAGGDTAKANELYTQFANIQMKLGVTPESIQQSINDLNSEIAGLELEKASMPVDANTDKIDKKIEEKKAELESTKKLKLNIETITNNQQSSPIIDIETEVEEPKNKEGIWSKVTGWFFNNPFFVQSEAKEPTPEELAQLSSNAEANTPPVKVKTILQPPSNGEGDTTSTGTVSIKTEIDSSSKTETQDTINSFKQTSTPSISVNPSPANKSITGVINAWSLWRPITKQLKYNITETKTVITNSGNGGTDNSSNLGGQPIPNMLSETPAPMTRTPFTPSDGESGGSEGGSDRPTTFASGWTTPVRVHNKAVDYLVYGVNLATELENKIKSLAQQLELLDARMEHAFGTKKINYMKEQIKLLEKQKQLQADLIKQLESEQSKLKTFLSSNGFKFDSEGGVTNYVAKLMEMNRKLDTIKNEKEYEKYKNNLDELTKALERYLDITFSELPDAVIEWEDLENQIKDVYKEQLEIAKETEEKLMDIYKKQIDDHKEMLEKQTEDTIKSLEKRVKAEVDAINEIQKAYNKAREEEDYQEELADKREALSDIERQIALASRDTSTAGKAKLEKLMEEYDNLKDDLDDFLQDREDKLVNDLFDDEKDRLEKESENEIERLEKELEEALKKLEDTYTEEKLMEMIKDAIATGQFTGIDGSVSDLNEVMLQFLNSTSEGLGATGQIIKNEWIGNLEIAKDVLKDIDNIVKELELDKFHNKNDMFKPETFSMSPQQSRTIIPQDMNVQRFIDGVANAGGKTVNFNQPLIQIAGNVTEEVMPKLEKFAKEVEKRITNNIVYAMR